MNSVLTLAFFATTLCAAFAIPASRWELVPDSEGHMRMVDLNSVYDEVSPAFIPENDIIFTVCTARNPTECQVIRWNDMDSVRSSHFNAASKTIFTVHGWGGSARDGTNVLLRDRFLRREDHNVRILKLVKINANMQIDSTISCR